MDLAVNFKGGGSIVELKPVFSSGGENVFVASKNSVYQYSTKTGNLLCEFKGWDTDIIGLNFNVLDNLECIAACSDTGQVIVWIVSKKIKLLEAQIPKDKIIFFSVLQWNLSKGLCVVVACKTKKKKVIFSKINLKKIDKVVNILKLKTKTFAADVCKDKYVAVVSANILNIHNVGNGRLITFSMAENNRLFTTICCHPEQEILLTGDNTGRVVLWQNIFHKKIQAVYHWHTLPVECLAFSTLGSQFYSGADENVLVKWQIDNPNQKQFLPRLPAGLRQLTVADNNAYVAVATADNAVRIVDSRMHQISLIQHLVLGNRFDCGIIYDPITRAIVMNGNVGCVQFYSPSDMSLLYNVDIVDQNRVTNERDCKLENTDVKKLAISKTGKWLATVEERREGGLCHELRLKFWHFNSEKQTYELNTSIEFPHEQSINSIAFQPVVDEKLKCVTVGNDLMFKVWEVAEVTTVQKTSLIWSCINKGTFRELSCKGISFSIDGSLFAVAFDKILTIWATENCEMKSSLVHSCFSQKILFVEFGQGNQCHLIVTASKNRICVWNILTLTMSWVVSLPTINLLVADPLSTYMLVICADKTEDHKVFVFEPSSSTILFSSNNLFATKENILAATFVPSMYSNDTRLKWYERANLYFITEKRKLYCISKHEEPYQYLETSEDLPQETSLFTKIKPKNSTSDAKTASKHHLFRKEMGYESYRQYLEAPIETLPPIRLLAVSLLKSLVLQRDNVVVSQ